MEEKNDILNQFGNENHFSVPENYFEDFAKNIQSKIKEKESSKRTIFMSRAAILFSAAATLVVAIFAAKAVLGTSNPTDLNTQTTLVAEQTGKNSDSWIAYLDENTQIESFVSNWEDEYTDY